MSPKVPSSSPESAAGIVVPLNDDAALYLALADSIAGTAVDMSPQARVMLRQGLVDRFGEIFGPRAEEAVEELLRLATTSKAA